MSAEKAPKRRSSSMIENSKYAPAQPPDDDRRQRLDSLGRDRAAIDRAKQEIAAIAWQQGNRTSASVRLDDLEVRQRKPLRMVVAPELPPDSAPNAGASVPSRDADRSTGAPAAPAPQSPATNKHVVPPAVGAAPKQANAIAPTSRAMFERIEHRPARSAAPARSLPTAPSSSSPRDQRYAPADVQPVTHEVYPPWEMLGPAARGQPIILLLVALVCVAVIWMFFQGPKTFISGYNGLIPSSISMLNQVSDPRNIIANVPAGEHSVVGAPSIDAAAIDTILSNYGSPAAGTGQAWIKLGQQYGIDPAYAVAFFIHESSAGSNPGWAGNKPGGDTTHNVGNIICAGYATCYGRFRDYGSWDEGIADWYKLIRDEYVSGRGAASVEQIIPIYAPSSDNNDVPGYINVVVSMVDGWRQGVLR